MNWIELDAGLGWVRPTEIVSVRRVPDYPDLSLVRLRDGTIAQVRLSPSDLMERLG